jgi:signal transduction histidine kinase
MRIDTDKKLKVLFWDDEAKGVKKLLFTEIKMGLNKYGWIVKVFNNREKAKDFALENDVNAVVLDLKENGVPVGLDILKYLKEKKPFLPVIMFTIWAEIEYIISAMRGEASFYLISPVKNYYEIVQAVEIAIEREKAKESILNERYFASIGELAAGVAHFIKNSLYNIQSRAQLLLDQINERDEAYEFLEVINRRCDDANKVVVDLLNFARGRKKKSEKKELSVVKNIKGALDLFLTDLRYKNIEINMNIKGGNGKIMGVEFELKEAFLNLVKNAVDAMPKGGTLTIDINAAGKEIIVEISDTGKGMSEETLKNVFVPFYTTKENSSGIGLFITQKIIHNHNGTIRAKSMEKKGTSFIITFPKIN